MAGKEKMLRAAIVDNFDLNSGHWGSRSRMNYEGSSFELRLLSNRPQPKRLPAEYRVWGRRQTLPTLVWGTLYRGVQLEMFSSWHRAKWFWCYLVQIINWWWNPLIGSLDCQDCTNLKRVFASADFSKEKLGKRPISRELPRLFLNETMNKLLIYL